MEIPSPYSKVNTPSEMLTRDSPNLEQPPVLEVAYHAGDLVADLRHGRHIAHQ